MAHTRHTAAPSQHGRGLRRPLAPAAYLGRVVSERPRRALLIGLLNIVLLTAMATIGAFVYNLSTDIVGGVEVTLADRD